MYIHVLLNGVRVIEDAAFTDYETIMFIGWGNWRDPVKFHGRQHLVEHLITARRYMLNGNDPERWVDNAATSVVSMNFTNDNIMPLLNLFFERKRGGAVSARLADRAYVSSLLAGGQRALQVESMRLEDKQRELMLGRSEDDARENYLALSRDLSDDQLIDHIVDLWRQTHGGQVIVLLSTFDNLSEQAESMLVNGLPARPAVNVAPVLKLQIEQQIRYEQQYRGQLQETAVVERDLSDRAPLISDTQRVMLRVPDVYRRLSIEQLFAYLLYSTHAAISGFDVHGNMTLDVEIFINEQTAALEQFNFSEGFAVHYDENSYKRVRADDLILLLAMYSENDILWPRAFVSDDLLQPSRAKLQLAGSVWRDYIEPVLHNSRAVAPSLLIVQPLQTTEHFYSELIEAALDGVREYVPRLLGSSDLHMPRGGVLLLFDREPSAVDYDALHYGLAYKQTLVYNLHACGHTVKTAMGVRALFAYATDPLRLVREVRALRRRRLIEANLSTYLFVLGEDELPKPLEVAPSPSKVVAARATAAKRRRQKAAAARGARQK